MNLALSILAVNALEAFVDRGAAAPCVCPTVLTERASHSSACVTPLSRGSLRRTRVCAAVSLWPLPLCPDGGCQPMSIGRWPRREPLCCRPRHVAGKRQIAIGCPPSLVLEVEAGACVQQEQNVLFTPCSACRHQRRLSRTVSEIEIGAALQQRSHRVRRCLPAEPARCQQRPCAIVAGDVHVQVTVTAAFRQRGCRCSAFHRLPGTLRLAQQLDYCLMICQLSCNEQSRVTPLASDRRISPTAQQHPHESC
mmetsp:Transcript_29055/g.69605  ORF Transcript_29055/g.69605 Transcript_29055/m.69605 type:complete len:252 (+) Transcript_29055:805-1560(+)